VRARRARNAAEGDEGGLLRVFSQGLSGFGRIALHIEQIVDDLKGETEVFAKAESAAMESEPPPATSAPAMADALKSAPVFRGESVRACRS
jgi:hypothetical protein